MSFFGQAKIPTIKDYQINKKIKKLIYPISISFIDLSKNRNEKISSMGNMYGKTTVFFY